MRINNVHVTGCDPSEISEQIIYDSWDWSHLPDALQQILRSNQKCSVYVYGTASCVNPTGADNIQAPVLTAIVLPTLYGPPTKQALRYDNQAANDELLTFDYLGYSWKKSDDPLCNGRVFYLAYDPELSSVPDSKEDPASYDHEYSTLYLPRPKELKADKNGKLIIDQVTFSFKDAEGELDYRVWDCDKDLDGFIGEVFKEHFKKLQKWNEDLEVDEEVTKKYLNEVISEAIGLARAKKQTMFASHFESVLYTQRQTNNIRGIVIVPVNFTAPITSKSISSGRCVDAFLQEQVGGLTYVADHYTFSRGGIRHQLPKSNFDIQQKRLHTLLIVDFADSIRHKISSDADLDTLVQSFSHRILDYIGSDLSAFESIPYLRSLIVFCKGLIADVRRCPDNADDFLLNFLLRHQPRTRNGNTLRTQPESLRLHPSGGVLQVKCYGNAYFKSISLDALKDFLSDPGIISSVLPLLYKPIGAIVGIPAGSRNEPAEDQESATVPAQQPVVQVLRRDCFKASLLLAPLDEYCKFLVREHLPDSERPFSEIIKLVEKEVKLVKIVRVRTDVHRTAMTAKCVMIGVFADGNSKHCVLIDGRETDGTEGTISDPLPEFEDGMPRCDETLKVLKITEFTELFIVENVKLSKDSMHVPPSPSVLNMRGHS